MPKLNDSRQKFITIYVKCFRHYRTKKLVFPKPPNTVFKLKIRADKYKAYMERKNGGPKKAA